MTIKSLQHLMAIYVCGLSDYHETEDGEVIDDHGIVAFDPEMGLWWQCYARWCGPYYT